MGIKRTLHRIRKERSAYFFIMPTFLLTIIFLFLPLVQGIRLSFFRASIKKRIWIGLYNYVKIFTRYPSIWLELKVTFIIALMLIPSLIIASLLIASLILRVNKHLQSFFRASFYLPAVVSGIVTSMVWIWIFNYHYGLLNYMLSLVGIEPVLWLAQANAARFAVAVVVFSWLLGTDVILYLSALSAIPKTVYEVADIDGANMFQKFFHITIPLTLPMTLYILMTSTIGAFQIWNAVYLLTGGGPGYETTTIAYRIYELGFLFFKFGEASAHAVILLIIIFCISFVQFKYLGKKLEF